MASEEERVNFLATGDSVLPAGAAQPMALGGGDVMRLPRLLLGTRQRILLEVRAVELPGLGGAAGEEGGGEGRPCDPMNRSTPGLPVHHQLPEFTQTHIHRVSDAIQPSHPLSISCLKQK